MKISDAVVVDAHGARDLLVVLRALQRKARQGDAFSRQVLGGATNARRFETLVREFGEVVVQAEVVANVAGADNGTVSAADNGAAGTMGGWETVAEAATRFGLGVRRTRELCAPLRRWTVGRSVLVAKADVDRLVYEREQEREHKDRRLDRN